MAGGIPAIPKLQNPPQYKRIIPDFHGSRKMRVFEKVRGNFPVFPQSAFLRISKRKDVV